MHSLTFTRTASLLHRCLINHWRVFRVDPTRLYYGFPQVSAGSPGVHTVDLRTDVATKPGGAMRKAMAEAEFGDVFVEDPTVNELQKEATDMFGMEAALFVPTGTMGNLIAVMVHCRERGDEMILGDLSYNHISEQGGSAQLAGVHSVTVTTLANGTFDLDQVISKIRHSYPGPHYPRSRLLRSVADKFGLAVHMDGARLMNAAVAQGVHPSVILQHCHSVSVSLSKGQGAPVGTMLGGSKDFIERAVRARKALGGGMRKTSNLVAAGRIALSDMIGRLEEDHRNARRFAEALIQCDSPFYQLDLATVETNIVRFHLQDQRLNLHEFCERMAMEDEQEVKALGQGVRVLMFPYVRGAVRAVCHLGINEEDTELAIEKARFVAQQNGLKS